MKYITTVDGQEYEVELLEDGRIRVGEQEYQVDLREVDDDRVFTVLVDGRSFEAALTNENDHLDVIIQGVRYQTEVVDEHAMLLRQVVGDSGALTEDYKLEAPMPGLVVLVPASIGQGVDEGDVLVILESMKMQNELRAPKAGVVTEVNVQAGDNVEKRQVLVVLGAGEE
ncbi:MAG TPA: biotin/lipoyl-containing protein [Anaerolineales bacterium]|nr:biotin/lipoyl-containing protein [Anaerolineales bacterium]